MMTKERGREYYIKNRVRIQESKKKYRSNPVNRQKELEYKRKYHALNKDKEREYALGRLHITRQHARKRYSENRGAILKQCKVYYHLNREKVCRQRTYSKYGLTKDRFDTMLALQDHKCPICQRSLKKHKPHIDHCHKKGKTRGILCRDCNVGLGCFRDSLPALRGAIDYLTENAIRTRT